MKTEQEIKQRIEHLTELMTCGNTPHDNLIKQWTTSIKTLEWVLGGHNDNNLKGDDNLE